MEEYQKYVIDDPGNRTGNPFLSLLEAPGSPAAVCFIELPPPFPETAARLGGEDRLRSRRPVADGSRFPTLLCAAPDVVGGLHKGYRRLQPSPGDRGANHLHLALMYMNNLLCAKRPVITNSNKLRTYTTANLCWMTRFWMRLSIHRRDEDGKEFKGRVILGGKPPGRLWSPDIA